MSVRICSGSGLKIIISTINSESGDVSVCSLKAALSREPPGDRIRNRDRTPTSASARRFGRVSLNFAASDKLMLEAAR